MYRMLIMLCILFQLNEFAFSQKAKFDIKKDDFDSIMIEGQHDITIKLSALSCEITKNGINLLSLTPDTTIIDNLYQEFVDGCPFLYENYIRQFPWAGIIEYDFEYESVFHLFKNDSLVLQFDIWYDTDYHYFTDEMLQFINHLMTVTGQLHSLYEHLLFRQAKMTKAFNQCKKQIQNGTIIFKEELPVRLAAPNPDNFYTKVNLYALVLAQHSTNETNPELYYNVDSLIQNNVIDKVDFDRYSSYINEDAINVRLSPAIEDAAIASEMDNKQGLSKIDSSKYSKAIKEFNLNLFEIRNKDVLAILNEGIKILNQDSIAGDYVILSMADCQYGTVLQINKLPSSLQSQDGIDFLGYYLYKDKVVLIQGKPSYKYFKKSNKKKTILIEQYEPINLPDYNPPTFLLPDGKYLRIKYSGLLQSNGLDGRSFRLF